MRLRDYRKILYRAMHMAAMLAAVACLVVLSAAQEEEEVPQITPRAGNVNKKRDQGPRALALLQLSPSGKVTLIPIAIRVGGRFYDAGAYKATPVPMALESGTVYEGLRTGKSVGLFTINGALHSNAATNPNPWLGTGMWLPTGTEAPKTGHKAEAVPVGIETSDEPPRLTKGGNGTKDTPAATAPPSSSPPPQNSPGTSSGSNPAGTNAPAQPAAPAPTSPKSTDQSSPPSKDQTPVQDTNRPRLRRGKPTEALPQEEDIPGYSKVQPAGSTPTKSGEGASTRNAAPAVAKGTQFVPAVSDAGGPDPRPYTFEWRTGEEEERRKQMLALAREQLLIYLDAQAKGKIAASPAGRPATARPAMKAAQPVLENVQLQTLDLWLNNQPVLVLTAEAHLPPASPKAKVENSPSDPAEPYTITVVARTDIYDNLHKLYSAVTDRYHLDVTPRLELIDAVDADGDGRGELLFRETTDAGSGYVIYRATTDKLWKMFDSLNPD